MDWNWSQRTTNRSRLEIPEWRKRCLCFPWIVLAYVLGAFRTLYEKTSNCTCRNPERNGFAQGGIWKIWSACAMAPGTRRQIKFCHSIESRLTLLSKSVSKSACARESQGFGALPSTKSGIRQNRINKVQSAYVKQGFSSNLFPLFAYCSSQRILFKCSRCSRWNVQ